MEKCTICSKSFPEATLRKMVQIIDRKAYLNRTCPSCQTIVANNPSYYYLVESKSQRADKN
ncbi:hypothetical protein [Syntrophomonas wolfei]|jgi:phage FluMu protein Com|uniref:hypothetical protein n=1 Tax=Syntrophomonas wolfei TaxID=863 RepID=UPI000774621A|nr:hypothetical protein [Syntrophomonas wolfei]